MWQRVEQGAGKPPYYVHSVTAQVVWDLPAGASAVPFQTQPPPQQQQMYQQQPQYAAAQGQAPPVQQQQWGGQQQYPPAQGYQQPQGQYAAATAQPQYPQQQFQQQQQWQQQQHAQQRAQQQQQAQWHQQQQAQQQQAQQQQAQQQQAQQQHWQQQQQQQQQAWQQQQQRAPTVKPVANQFAPLHQQRGQPLPVPHQQRQRQQHQPSVQQRPSYGAAAAPRPAPGAAGGVGGTGGGGAQGWPPALKGYLKRAYQVVSDGLRPKLEAELRTMIDTAVAEKVLWEIDWIARPLPPAAKASQAAASVAASSSSQSSRPGRGKKRSRWGGDAGAARPAYSGPPRPPTAEELRRAKRMQRFEKGRSRSKSTRRGAQSEYLREARRRDGKPPAPIIGTCAALEKSYFRLTSEPLPETVRPAAVLVRALIHFKTKWAADGSNYEWACDQLKAMRQDLTVQHIEDALAVDTYETHARIALEAGDLNEFNQCQTQLFELYESNGADPTCQVNRSEFIAYRMLYLAYTGMKGKTELLEVIRELTQDDVRPASTVVSAESAESVESVESVESKGEVEAMILHAQKARVAYSSGNYVRFFRLQREAKRMTIYLMQEMAISLRLAAMRSICRAYRPSVQLDWLASNLGFNSDCVDIKAWFEERGATVGDDGAVNTKAVTSCFATAAIPEKVTSLTESGKKVAGVGVQIETLLKKYGMSKGTTARIESSSANGTLWCLDNGKTIVKAQLGVGWKTI